MQSKLDMEDFVISLLKDNLSEFYYYHNYKHTLYVTEIVSMIGRHEGCSGEELDLLNAAALWHDTGYTVTYKNHEEESCRLAQKYLPQFGYTAQNVVTICGLIMATKIPQIPKNKLEEILADADLEYLGTADYKSKADDLFWEIKYVDPSLTEEKWKQIQISFLQKHRYFTRFCQLHRENVKQIYLKELIQSIG